MTKKSAFITNKPYMHTELICVGTELLSGKVNTNCAYIGEKLSSIGLDLSRVTTVGDNVDEIAAAVKSALEKSRFVFLTGGLGPTFDDLTREGVAKALGRELALNREAVAEIARYFLKRGIEMPKINERQGYLIEGAAIMENTVGTAPGQRVEASGGKRGAVIYLLPGPPREMQVMFEHAVFPELKSSETRIKKSFILHICGMPESAVDEKIRPVVEAERRLEAGVVDFTILAHQMIVDVKASVAGPDEMLVDETFSALKHELREILGEAVYGEDRQTLESVAGELLMKNKKTLALAESCTGGLVAAKVTSIPGSSLYFKQGVVAYANEAKMQYLGVKKETLEKHGAVSEETAREMAQGMKRASGADYAISLTGIAGPSGGSAEKPVGLVFIGISGPDSDEVFRYRFPGNRTDVRERASNHALDLLRRRLMKRK